MNSGTYGEERTTLSKRMRRYRPAVTRVEECTKEEIGVGALIATGNQGENGKIALLVIRPKHRTKGTKGKTLVG